MADRRVVIIRVEGGCVTEVEHPLDVDVRIIDLDTEGSDTEGLCKCEMAPSPHFHAEHLGEKERSDQCPNSG